MRAVVQVLAVAWIVAASVFAQHNRAPHFVPGGDMARLSLPEDTLVGTPVYTLRGEDPDGAHVHYSISGQSFAVNRETGVVTLVRPLDREKQDRVEVIISLTDDAPVGSEPNTVSLRREIPVIDRNDNPPKFEGRPYLFSVVETARVGSVVYEGVVVTDADSGVNGELGVTCDPVRSTPSDACDTFDIKVVERTRYPGTINPRNYTCQLVLKKALDFERRSSYSLALTASDNALDKRTRLSATATVAVQVQDVQDQPPMFLNAPFSATLPEQMAAGVSVLTVRAKDGDAGEPRKITLALDGDTGGHFRLRTDTDVQGGETVATLLTTDVPLDREDPRILQNGGIYTFNVVATEIAGAQIIGDVSKAQIMIIITDIDDQLPAFNQENFIVEVSEDISKDSPLPGLNLFVDDNDVGDNANYKLSLRSTTADVDLSEVFSLQPASGSGHTPVLIRVRDPRALDFDAPISAERTLTFDVVASVTRDGREVDAAHAHVTVRMLDANDHAPSFYKSVYKIHVPENLKPGFLLQQIEAKDADSAAFGRIAYSLQGFGAERFSTDPDKGGLYLARTCPPGGCVDYETQKSYSLTLTAKDGGGKIATTSIVIDVDDINDNAPKFEQNEYKRTIREGATSLDPQFFVRATDIDGPTQGSGAITYSITSSNAPEGTFLLDSNSGELKLLKTAAAGDTPFGQYELKVKASDHGSPTAASEVPVNIRVGVPGNQQPIFKGGPVFAAKVAENIPPGEPVVKVNAHDPDGPDPEVTYRIVSGARDNFVIDQQSGQISVAPGGIAEREDFKILVAAVDAGKPYRATATATVMVHVSDINNEPPKFSRDSYEKHVSERLAEGELVLKVSAADPDLDAKLVYSILEPVVVKDKTGVEVKSKSVEFFKINQTTGEIFSVHKLDHQLAAIITFGVRVEDQNAVERVEMQHATTEVTVYVEAYSDDNPAFNAPWSAGNPVISVKLGDRRSMGTEILALAARDPLRNGAPVTRFQLLSNDDDLVLLTPDAKLQLNKDLPYDATNQTHTIVVKAIADSIDGGADRSSEATVLIELSDVNHYTPQFTHRTYKSRVAENARFPATVLTVNATDNDGRGGPSGHGEVRYSLAGAGSHLFAIDPVTGIVSVADGAALDRETQSELNFNVVATDTPRGGAEQRKSTAHIQIDVLDVNDNAPKFERDAYSAVTPENVAIGWSVIKVVAKDPDESLSGEVEFEIADEGDAQGLFTLDAASGEIKTRKLLTGKGRQRPYRMLIRALDRGQPSLSSDAPLDIYISDVASNDGVPIFLRPMPNETAFVAENSTIGSPVFQVVSSDPDDPNTANGRLTYRLLDNGKFGRDTLAFSIEPESGLITTRQPLDRERQSEFTLIIVVQDDGSPPQKASSVLRVEVTDVDDHKPIFRRTLQDDAVPMRVREDAAPGTEIGSVTAVDDDVLENAAIDYMIIYGNDENVFNISRSKDNKGVIRLNKRVDREAHGEHLLTIKCFPLRSKPSSLRKEFNALDPSEIQVRIGVDDVDDNLPIFKEGNLTVGVRLNVPVDTPLVTLEAMDADADAPPVHYSLLGAEFHRSGGSDMGVPEDTPIFSLNEKTGELHTAASLAPFADGIFTLIIGANNSDDDNRGTNTTVKVFILRDSELLKFVFAKPMSEVRRSIPQFQKEVENTLPESAQLNLYDTQFFSKKDGSLDFSTTTSCFQLLGESSFDVMSMQSVLNTDNNPALAKVFAQYGVQSIEKCSPSPEKVKATTIQIWVLAIAALVGVLALISSIVVCCLHGRYKRQMARLSRRSGGASTASNGGYAYIMSPGPAGSVMMNAAAPSVISQSMHGSEWPAEFLGTPASLLPPGVVGSQSQIHDNTSTYSRSYRR